jgi:chromosome partitioning protein
MPRVIAVSSQKGGIRKTTMNLAVAWSEFRQRVLLVDLDPQFALTRRFGVSPADVPATAFELLAGEGSFDDAAVCVGRRLELLAGHRHLAKLELSPAEEHHREEFVRDLLEAEAVGYDTAVIDCPPNLGLLTVNAIVAAGEVLVPVNMTDEGALQGAAEVRAIVGQLARRVDVCVRAPVRQMVDYRRIVYQQMNAGLPELGLPIARAEIPLAAAFQNAAAERIPLLQWRASCPGADAYRDLAAELLDPVSAPAMT